MEQQEVKTKRQQLSQAYADCCVKLGNIEYQKFALDLEAEKLHDQMLEINQQGHEAELQEKKEANDAAAETKS